ncbi:UvrD-helicase domain-containing protein [Pedobacter heparinus]|uniref:UvrD-helicase domain-containing protein n=1 Tax=Pedobacter heparinus TaxID=984 RepID=UPI00292E627C|nr:UvrD-helicase domain-containing protein [Pedobacter heparinus]
MKTDANTISLGTIILGIVTTIGLVYLYKIYNKRKRAEIRQQLGEIELGIKEFSELTNLDHYFSNFSMQAFHMKFSTLRKTIPSGFKSIGLEPQESEKVSTFVNIIDNLPAHRAEYNERFVPHEIKKYNEFFSCLEEYPLSLDQMRAVVTDEDNNLVIAGAGTGKTTTISAKVAYILEKGLAGPEEMLIISFTQNAVKEMYNRTIEFCGWHPDVEKITVRTFNGFGNMVCRSCTDYPIKLAFDDEYACKAFLQDSFDDLFLHDKDFSKKATNFITLFDRPPVDESEFKTRNEYLKHQRTHKYVSLNGIKVKSHQELQIANFLLLNGISFIYEQNFPLMTEDLNPQYQSYAPDFYLPDYEIYHEHYGIDENGDVPDWFGYKPPFQNARDQYHNGIQWKESIHAKYKTRLIKTYSFQAKRGRHLLYLKHQLENLGVEFKSMKAEDILPAIKETEHYENFIGLVYTFLQLMKSNNASPENFKQFSGDQRLRIFLDVFTPLYRRYEQKLIANHSIDFSDMINSATHHISSGEYDKKYKYILVDEFQDMSLGRYGLLKALKKANPSAKLYAVGDDWQSIFRFTGSDISIITDFSSHFGVSANSEVLKTYRFNREILELSSGFIQKNPAQLAKSLSSEMEALHPSFELCPISVYGSVASQALFKWDMLNEIISRISLQKQSAKIFIIGRYKHNRPPDLNELQKKYTSHTISYFTAHSSKGLTCDYTILMDLDSGVFGFPAEMADDPILSYLLHEGDGFENAEERRLFYVALTRARHKVFLLYNQASPSKFIDELIADGVVAHSGRSNQLCPECSGILMERKGKGANFLGCSNYPSCRYKTPNIN